MIHVLSPMKSDGYMATQTYFSTPGKQTRSLLTHELRALHEASLILTAVYSLQHMKGASGLGVRWYWGKKQTDTCRDYTTVDHSRGNYYPLVQTCATYKKQLRRTRSQKIASVSKLLFPYCSGFFMVLTKVIVVKTIGVTLPATFPSLHMLRL